MKKNIFSILSAILLLTSAIPTWAETVSVSAKVDSLVLMIGEQAKVSIEAIQPEKRVLQFPVFSDTVVTGLELVSTLKPDTMPLGDGMIHVRADYVVTAFDSALIYMSGFPVVDGEETLYTNPLTLKILDMPVDTTQQAITDIKGVYDPPFDWMRFWTIVGYVLLALIVAIAVVYIIIRLKKRKSTIGETEKPEYIDPRSAYDIAIEELEQLRQKKLWQTDRYKEYYTELTDIVRRYIHHRYGIGAMEQASEDLLAEFRINKELRDKKQEISLLTSVLKLADLVKFAKWIPLADENDKAFTQTKEFIELTKDTENKEPENKNGQQ